MSHGRLPCLKCEILCHCIEPNHLVIYIIVGDYSKQIFRRYVIQVFSLQCSSRF
ncbi:hypothetical protein NFI96_019730 [Prochilodus magdalenae]|nr:hypothetical protein NFI96_019730 [Prochilodus magdalenae]